MTWEKRVKAREVARQEQALCGVQEHDDMRIERDNLRVALGDLLEERGMAALFAENELLKKKLQDVVNRAHSEAIELRRDYAQQHVNFSQLDQLGTRFGRVTEQLAQERRDAALKKLYGPMTDWEKKP